MKQALHIFRKDLQYLRLEAALVIALVVLCAAMDNGAGVWWAEMLLGISAALLIGRLVHAEAIPGNRQFWITRPYRPSSLFLAKLLFVTVFVSLPLLLAQFYIVAQAGFPKSSILSGLFWSQTLTLVGVLLPLGALAALTAGIAPFLFIMLLLLALGFSSQQMMWMHLRIFPRSSSWPVSVEWVRESALLFGLALTAACVLYVQYKYRRTTLGRIVASAGLAIAGAAYFYMPWRFGLATQLGLSSHGSQTVAVAIDPAGKLSRGPVPGRREERFQIRVPLVIQSNAPTVPDAFELRLQGADGRSWSVASGGVNANVRVPGTFEATALAPQSLIAEVGTQELRARGTIWLTLFEQSNSETVRMRNGPVNVMDGLRCYLGEFDHVWCRSAFRWPNRLIYIRAREGDVRSLNSMISYSPFPGGPGFHPIEARWAPGTVRPDDEITIIAQKPVAHLRRDFDVGTFRFSDLSVGR